MVLDDCGVGRVQQSVEAFATPSEPQVDLGPEGAADHLEAAQVDAGKRAILDLRDQRPMDARRTGEVLLGHLRADPQRPHLPPETDIVHAPQSWDRCLSAAYLASYSGP